MSSGTYISSPGVLNTSPTATTVYLLSSINDVGKEIIVRDAAPLTTGRVVVSTTKDIYFNRDLCGAALLSSFVITQPFDYITVASRTPREYMLLQASTTPTRTNNQAFAPNFLQISTLSTLATVASSNAALGNLVLGGPILKDPTTDTRLAFSTITATAYLSTGLATISTAQTVDTVANQINTTAATTSYSAYTGIFSTLRDYTVANTLAIGGSLLQTGDLKVLGAAGTTIGGTAWFGSTLQANTARVALNTAFGSSLSLISSLTLADTLSTLTTWSSAGAFYTSNYTALNNISTSSYNAGQTINTGKTYVGGSNAVPPTTATTTVTGSTYVGSMWITPFTSTNTVSTVSGTVSSINFINNLGAQVRVRGEGTNIAINEVVLGGGSLAPLLSTITTSFWTSTAQYVTSTLQHATPATAPYTYDMRGDAFISTALIADTLAIYDGTNAAAFTNPTNNTIYLSTNGMLINNRLFIDHLQNRVGVNTVNPQYTLDISGLIYHTSSIAYNVGGGSSWVVVSDSAAKENIVTDINYDPYKEMIQNLKLKEYTYSDVPEERTVTIPITGGTTENPIITGYYDVSQIIQPGFASQYGLKNHREYGFIAQDVEFYFPNAVYEAPFYKYPDFRFLNVDQIMKAHYAITRSMLQTVKTHSTIIGHRRDFISTASDYQNRILADLSANVGAPFNIINPPQSYPTIADWEAPLHPIIDSSANLTTAPNIRVTWSLGTGASAPKYRIYYKPAASTTYNAVTITDPTARSYDLSANFVHSSSYDIFVATLNILDAESAGAVYRVAFYYPPAQPSAVTAIPIDNLSLAVSWVAPTYTPQYYSVSWNTADPADISGSVSNIAGTQTFYTTPSLTANKEYTVAVKSVSAAFMSPPVTTTQTPVLIPDPPATVAVTYRDLGFNVAWTPSPSVGVTSYSVFYKLTSASIYTEITGASSPTAITGLTDLAVHDVYVAAAAGSVKSDPNPATYTAYSFPITTVFSATSGSAQLTLSFTANLTGGTFQKFTIYNSTSGSDIFVANITSASIAAGYASGSYTVTGLTNGTAYTYKLITVATEAGITQESTPITVTKTPFAYPTLTAGTTTEGDRIMGFTMTATTYGGTIKEYRRYSAGGKAIGDVPISTLTTSSSSASFTVGDGVGTNGSALINGARHDSYFYVVVTVDGVDYMSQSALPMGGIPYGTPIPTQSAQASIPTTASTDARKITIATSTFNTNGSAITSYKIYLYDSTSTLVSGYPSTVSSLAQTLTGLSHGSYTVKVSAINARGEGGLSNSSSTVTVWSLPTISVTNVAYSASTGTTAPSITLTWSATLNGVHSVTGYDLYSKESATAFISNTTTNPYTISSTNHGITITSGQQNYAYFYIVPKYRLTSGGTIYTPLKADSATYLTSNILVANVPNVPNLSTTSTVRGGTTNEGISKIFFDSHTPPTDNGSPITEYTLRFVWSGGTYANGNYVQTIYSGSTLAGAQFDMSVIDTSFSMRGTLAYTIKALAKNSRGYSTDSGTLTSSVTVYRPPTLEATWVRSSVSDPSLSLTCTPRGLYINRTTLYIKNPTTNIETTSIKSYTATAVASNVENSSNKPILPTLIYTDATTDDGSFKRIYTTTIHYSDTAGGTYIESARQALRMNPGLPGPNPMNADGSITFADPPFSVSSGRTVTVTRTTSPSRQVTISFNNIMKTGVLTDCKIQLYRTTSSTYPTFGISVLVEYTFNQLTPSGSYYTFTHTDSTVSTGNTYYYFVSFSNTIGDRAGNSSVSGFIGSLASPSLSNTTPFGISF